jgi:hypothetical protein
VDAALREDRDLERLGELKLADDALAAVELALAARAVAPDGKLMDDNRIAPLGELDVGDARVLQCERKGGGGWLAHRGSLDRDDALTYGHVDLYGRRALPGRAGAAAAADRLIVAPAGLDVAVLVLAARAKGQVVAAALRVGAGIKGLARSRVQSCVSGNYMRATTRSRDRP